MKLHRLVIAAALPFAFVACKEAEVEKAKADMKTTADEAAGKMKEAGAKIDEAAKDLKDDAAAKVEEAGAKIDDAAKDMKEKAAEKLDNAADKLREE